MGNIIGFNPCRYCKERRCKMCELQMYRDGVIKNSEWISVEERLPENDYGKHWKERQYYLVMTEPTGLMRVARYGYKEYGWWVDGHSCVLDERNYKRVTHWMPLPEAPKMKGGAE
jgi:hypothetical protein